MSANIQKLKDEFKINDKDLATYRKAFIQHDRDRNGLLNRAETLNSLDECKLQITKEEYNDFIKQVTLTKNKQIDELNFIKVRSRSYSYL
jgi:Ca2+-binding EF-hand superfamily protein